MGSSNSGAPPPLPLPGGITVHDNARNTDDYERRRCATDETEESRSLRRGYREENPGRCRRGPTREEARRYDTGVDSGHGGSSFGADAGRPAGSGDALTHEVDQRPHVRGSLNEGPQGWPDHGVGGSEVGRGHERESIEPSVTRRDGSYRGWGLERGQRDPGPERDQLAVGEDGAFFTSLRGEGCGRNGDGVSRRSAKRYPRRPEWNNDTAGAASLGGAHVAIVTENSPASVQVGLFFCPVFRVTVVSGACRATVGRHALFESGLRLTGILCHDPTVSSNGKAVRRVNVSHA